jgi:hypothetical protein
MNRLFKVLLALSLSVLAVVILLLNTRTGQPDLRQEAVQTYVSFKRATMNQSLTIGQYVWASMPQNFRAELSRDSFGNATYYQPTQYYAQAAQPTPTHSLTATPLGTLAPYSMTTSAYRAGRPLPYPPTDLWCVQLISPDPAAPKVVLAALHQDIYNAEWIVHEMTDLETVLPAVGCKLSTQ